MSNNIRMDIAQRRLAIMWVVMILLLTVIVVIQSVGGIYAFGKTDVTKRVWEWLIPIVFPFLTLILGSVFSDIAKPPPATSVNRTPYRIAFWLSVMYLSIVGFHLFIFPNNPLARLQRLDDSHLMFAALQGVVGLALGAFFKSRTAD